MLIVILAERGSPGIACGSVLNALLNQLLLQLPSQSQKACMPKVFNTGALLL